MPALSARPASVRVLWRYVRAIEREFRVTFAVATVAVLVGALLYAITPHSALQGQRPGVFLSLYASWMALFGQTLFNPPETWYLEVLHGVYPLIGFVVLGEGIVRFALLMTSRRRGEREWITVMASTYQGHIVLCGLGQLGYRIFEHLRQAGAEVVALERDPNARFLAAARATGSPVLVGDMRDDQLLIDAGIDRARAVIVATNDDIANIEVALDSRRMNPKIKVMIRFFDPAIAAKVKAAFDIDEAFSSAALAAPVIAGMALEASPAGDS